MTKRKRLSIENRKFYQKKNKHHYIVFIFFSFVLATFLIFYPQIVKVFSKIDLSENIPRDKESPALSILNETQTNDTTGRVIPGDKDSIEEIINPDLTKSISMVNTDSIAHIIVPKSDTQEFVKKPELLILNGCGIPGTAERFKKFLEEDGYAISGISNYKSFNVKHTFIISQKETDKSIENLASHLKIPGSRIMLKKVNLSSDIILVIGKDYRNLPPYNKN